MDVGIQRTPPIAGECVADWRSLVAAQLRRVQVELHDCLSGATVGDMRAPIALGVNPPGWLAWHLTRSHDRNFSEIAGRLQLWTNDGWHDRFHRPRDPNDTGYLHTREQVHHFEMVEGDVVLAYHDAVVAMALLYLDRAPVDDLARVAPSPTLKTSFTVQERLVGVLNEAMQHLGQIRLSRPQSQSLAPPLTLAP
jgi:DinB superfamily